MRKAERIETLYLDFDGFFASVMQQAMPALRGRPVGVVPFDVEAAKNSVLIAASREAKAAGCKNIMSVAEAQRICPQITLVAQRPDLFRRAHNALLSEIGCEIPIDTVKSIDELACKLDTAASAEPRKLAQRIQDRLRKNIGPYITCSIGFAANRLLAKIASSTQKPNGITIWDPCDMPRPLLALTLQDIPGISHAMEMRLNFSGIRSMQDLIETQPKKLRAIWGNVNGERMWYALHGYDICAQPTGRSMYGHGRVLPPEWRDMSHAFTCSRLLLTKAARRMRRDGFYAGRLLLWLQMPRGSWSAQIFLPAVQDDFTCLAALNSLWNKARAELFLTDKIIRLGVTLMELSPASQRQLDIFLNDDARQRKYETLTHMIDRLNRKFGKRVLTVGEWAPPPGGYAGGKIAYNRIPLAEDFW